MSIATITGLIVRESNCRRVGLGSAMPLLGQFYSRRLNGSAALLYDGPCVNGWQTLRPTRLAPNLSTHAPKDAGLAVTSLHSSGTSHLFLPHHPILAIRLLVLHPTLNPGCCRMSGGMGAPHQTPAKAA